MTASPSGLPPRLLRLLAWKRWILINTLIVAVVAVVVSLLLPKWYLATTTIFPPEREGGMPTVLGGEGEGTLSMSLMASLIGGGAYDMPLFSSPSDILARIARSRTLGERLIEKYDLKEHYDVEKTDDALEILDSLMDIRVGREGVVSIAVLERDPQLAADMANDIVRMIDEIQSERRHTAAGTARRFVARRLEETRGALVAAEDSLRRFQRETGIVAPDEQAQAVVDAMAALSARRIGLEVQRETLLEIAGPNHPRVKRLESDISVIDEAMAKLGTASTGAGPDTTRLRSGSHLEGNGEAVESLSSMSGLMLEYQRLLREVKIQETLNEYLITRHEYYRIEEVRDTPTVQVLDEASVPDRKTKPVRWLICALSTLLAFIGSLIVFNELERLRESAVTGGLLSQAVERLGGASLVRRLRSSAAPRT